MSLVYNLFYGMVLVIYLLILGMSLNNPYKPARGFGWLIQDSLDMLSLLLLSFGGILAVLELIGPTAWLLSHRVADWMKNALWRCGTTCRERPAIPRSRRSL